MKYHGADKMKTYSLVKADSNFQKLDQNWSAQLKVTGKGMRWLTFCG